MLHNIYTLFIDVSNVYKFLQIQHDVYISDVMHSPDNNPKIKIICSDQNCSSATRIYQHLQRRKSILESSLEGIEE